MNLPEPVPEEQVEITPDQLIEAYQKTKMLQGALLNMLAAIVKSQDKEEIMIHNSEFQHTKDNYRADYGFYPDENGDVRDGYHAVKIRKLAKDNGNSPLAVPEAG